MSHVNVSVEDDHLDAMGSVVQALRERGMTVEHVLEGLGIVTGSVADHERALLEGVPGVAEVVDGQLTYRLPAPDAEIQ